MVHATMKDSRPVIAQVLHRMYVAGAEVLAADLARRLGGRYRFVFLCLDEIGPLGHTLGREGIGVFDLERRPGLDRRVARRVRQIINVHRVALLHAHQYTPFFYAAVARGLRRQPAMIFTEHGRHYPDQRKLKRVVANRFLIGRADRVTAVARFVKQALVNHEGINPDRIEVIHNGIDPAQFDLVDRDRVRAVVRNELGLRRDQPVALQVARFHPVKDHVTSLRAFARVVADVSDAVLLLAGAGRMRSEMQALASQLGLGDRVRFLGERSDVADLMAAADVFVLSSLSEGASVTLLEAMGAKLPIAATAVGGNEEVVAHDESGLLSPRGDANSLGANLAALLRSADLRARMGHAGHARLLDQFTQNQMHERYVALYDQMLKRG